MKSLRLERLLEMSTRGKPFSNWFKPLKAEDWTEMLRFLKDHDHLDKDQFQYHLNRYFIDFELRLKRPKPKGFLNIDQILGNVNNI